MNQKQIRAAVEAMLFAYAEPIGCLLYTSGRLDLPGRPVAFRTTDVFLRCFGLSSLEDLPPVRGMESEAAQ